jgi:hypothetical protein
MKNVILLILLIVTTITINNAYALTEQEFDQTLKEIAAEQLKCANRETSKLMLELAKKKSMDKKFISAIPQLTKEGSSVNLAPQTKMDFSSPQGIKKAQEYIKEKRNAKTCDVVKNLSEDVLEKLLKTLKSKYDAKMGH